MPLLSVVVPVFRVEDYLAECLDSILGQGFDDLEVIAVDDASDDGSGAILARYAAADPRLTVLTLPQNKGLGAARNAGLAAATGDYVWFVDSDDWLTEGTLRAVADRLAETDADMLVTGFARVFPDGRVRHSPVTAAGPAPDVFRLVDVPGLINVLHIACNKVVRRKLLVDLGLTFRPGWYEDVSFTFPLMIAAERITLLDRYAYGYRQRDTGAITRTVSDRHFEVFDQWDFALHFLDSHADPALREPIFQRAIWHLLQVLGHAARVPRRRRREFFGRLVTIYRAWRPEGSRMPGGDLGLKHRLVARDAFRLFEALRTGRQAQKGLVRLVRRRPEREAGPGVEVPAQRSRPAGAPRAAAGSPGADPEPVARVPARGPDTVP